MNTNTIHYVIVYGTNTNNIFEIFYCIDKCYTLPYYFCSIKSLYIFKIIITRTPTWKK